MYKFNPNVLLLCVFNSESKSNSCVSSIILKYELDNKKTITIDSKTNYNYEKKKMNLLLRSMV